MVTDPSRRANRPRERVPRAGQLSARRRSDIAPVRAGGPGATARSRNTVASPISGHSARGLKRDVLAEFCELAPHRFSNKTNGVTPRRWVVLANPRLSALLTELLGEAWPRDLTLLRGLEAHVDDSAFLGRWRAIKRANKEELVRRVAVQCGLRVRADSLFDVQVKRIHEYKRQHLMVLHIIALYLRVKNGVSDGIPRTFIFAGKAAPGYAMAKLVIKLINSVAAVINRDADVRDLLQVVFMPNFSVMNSQPVYPAADLSEQISTAGKEASGTGNMKFAMNGAVTIGTLDGANIELREEVGEENFFLFGHKAHELGALRRDGYRPRACSERDPELAAVLDLLGSGFFSRGDTTLFEPLLRNLLDYDPYFVLADFTAYAQCQRRAAEAWLARDTWTRMSVLNCARGGKFSSDRTISEYVRDIWRAPRVPIRLLSRPEVAGGFLRG